MSTRTSGSLGLVSVDATAASVAVIASVLAAAIVFLPSWRTQALQAALMTRRTDAEQRQHAAGELLRAAQRELDETAAEVASNGVKTLPASALNTKLAEFVDLAGLSAMRLDALVPGERIRTSRTVSVQIKMRGLCDLAAFQDFLHRLRARCPDVAVVAMLLGRHDPSGTDAPASPTNSTRFTLDLVWHAAPEGPIAGNPSSAP